LISESFKSLFDEMLNRVQHDNKRGTYVDVIPNQPLNLALKQDQGLKTSVSNDFGISVSGLKQLGFKATSYGDSSLLSQRFCP
jgi:hypothetical protein